MTVVPSNSALPPSTSSSVTFDINTKPCSHPQLPREQSIAPPPAILSVEELAAISSAGVIKIIDGLLGPRVNSGAASLEANLTWLVERTQLSMGALLSAAVYLDRFLAKHSRTRFREPMRPLVTCLVLGMKYAEDAVYSNATWANLLGIPLAKLNKCEVEFLGYLEFDLYIADQVFASMAARACKALAAADADLAADVALTTPDGAPSSSHAPAANPVPAASPAPTASLSPATNTNADPAPAPAADKVSPGSSPAAAAEPRRSFLRRLVGSIKSSLRSD
ncbi:uncharacterized protein AMSG_05522 [Thecamonas trahens ATCC 50062]|uniref:Cyclin N-terminal domain-containing protein n=1 Tax=Thecamonas trahens ATCC 50062 TaxID=461836 RepID=A0A0L0DAX6_THETB|nr:hypothetical protein AMSG_05522 [Thecamonas trahens ATCC 50062]KNC49504.1 hypothetical protein AMSG_05522 [Thecamonas trahens ATCC 50062]|eukprot:XP_013757621.1 hypothetical protein AMSG_05522 [Thecamonas trahens ATCC 50062]